MLTSTPDKVEQRIIQQLEKVLNVKFDDAYAIVVRCSSLSNVVYAKLSVATREYLNAMSGRIRRNEPVLLPGEYFRRKAIKRAPTELPPQASKQRSGATDFEIGKALVLAKGMIPSSHEIHTAYGITKRAAIDLRRRIMFVLKVLRDAKLYKHATLAASIRYGHLRQKPREKKAKI
jgi:hypothetical protein